MTKEKNPYLEFMDDMPAETGKKPVANKPVESIKVFGEGDENVPVAETNPNENPYLDLVDTEQEKKRHDIDKSLVGALFGSGAGYLSSGAGRNPFSPSPEAIAKSSAASLAESLTNAPTGSVKEVAEALSTPKKTSGISQAVKTIAEARNPSPAPLPPESVVKVKSQGAGEKWLQNWGGIEKEIEGGVPEGSQAYNRMKPQGKVTSKLFKKFGMNPQLNIEGYTAAQAGIDAERAMQVRQELFQAEMRKIAEQNHAKQVAERAAQVEREAAATGRALKLAAPLTTVNRVLTGAGLGLGGYDAYRRYKEGDTKGSALTAGATLAGTVFPPVAPLAGATVSLYDDPEARRKFLEGMQGQGAFAQRESRFGLD